MGAVLRKFLLEGFLAVGELGGISIGGCLVGASSVVSGYADGAAARGCGGTCLVGVAGDVGTAVGSGYGDDRADDGSVGAGGCLIEVNAIAADMGAAVVLTAVSVSASALVVATVSAVVIALVAIVLDVTVVLTGVFAIPVLS